MVLGRIIERKVTIVLKYYLFMARAIPKMSHKNVKNKFFEMIDSESDDSGLPRFIGRSYSMSKSAEPSLFHFEVENSKFLLHFYEF